MNGDEATDRGDGGRSRRGNRAAKNFAASDKVGLYTDRIKQMPKYRALYYGEGMRVPSVTALTEHAPKVWEAYCLGQLVGPAILRHGRHVEVLEPPELRLAVQSEPRQALNQYQSRD